MNTNTNNKIAIAIIAGLFFIFGFVTWVNGALIPFMKTINELTEAQSYLVASASYSTQGRTISRRATHAHTG